MSPTTVIAWIRLGVAFVLAVYIMIKLFTEGGVQNGASISAAAAVHGAAATAVWFVIDKLLGLAESRFTADNKDIKELEKKIDQ